MPAPSPTPPTPFNPDKDLASADTEEGVDKYLRVAGGWVKVAGGWGRRVREKYLRVAGGWVKVAGGWAGAKAGGSSGVHVGA